MNISGALISSYLKSNICSENKEYLLSIDTRNLNKNTPSCFVAIEGLQFDGHQFVSKAVELGAEIIVVKKGFKPAVPIKYLIEVTDTTVALQDIAHGVRCSSDIPWIALTGSVGKTSTRHVISKILKKLGPVLETLKNNNNQIGVPLTVFALEPKHKFAVVEAGTNHFGEIKPLAEILEPDFAVITNIGRVHVEHLRDEFGVAEEKGELLKTVKSNGLCLLNADSLCLKELKAMCRSRCLTYGMQAGDIRAEIIEENVESIWFTVEGNEFVMPNLGRHFIYNFLPAYCIAKELGVPMEAVKDALQVIMGVPGRLEVRLTEPLMVIDDSYNASVDSMKAAIDFLCQQKSAKRRVAILGDMKELGSYTEESHRIVLEKLNEMPVDLVLSFGDEWGRVIDDCSKDWEHFKSKSSLIKFCETELQRGDAILLKASNSVRFSEIVDEILEAWKGR